MIHDLVKSFNISQNVFILFKFSQIFQTITLQNILFSKNLNKLFENFEKSFKKNLKTLEKFEKFEKNRKNLRKIRENILENF